MIRGRKGEDVRGGKGKERDGGKGQVLNSLSNLTW